MPPAQCATYRCKAPAIKGSVYCLDHAPKNRAATDRRKLDAYYQSATWQKIRTAHLSSSPLCMACKHAGRIVPATVVDHVFPWKQYGPQAFTLNVFNSLCPPCHSVKTASESRGVFRHYLDGEIRDYGATDWPGAVWLALRDAKPSETRDY